ncbi:sigma factor-like helix-turn-helix DNA-binding protein [Bifidobacterium tibiigranuli]|jgi:DNA-directed RNA polymerase specialized sigma subunit|uniref:sigma factor-like helix-turn-helix DNA-binding protein n=1 Tax=Bifidobacterium tibiigranuli TaxID=2172043 RepID=UPI002352D3A4|nr:sigma factor-like helix-turn-helix DNA-binding protein [Bifidobacterium tibiigranuli]MCI1713633.1 hypothetical protein [Bifidobacterium tibiigranuli]MCI1798465.1 hypothetical protein [Bifidobacterium tibiigranuli]
MKTIEITAKPWDGGWELWHGDEVWTQVNTLARARQQVVDYLDTIEEGISHDNMIINVTPEVAGWREASEARNAAKEAEQSRHRATELARHAARRLRGQGISLADTASMLGVSRGRVSQLVKQG